MATFAYGEEATGASSRSARRTHLAQHHAVRVTHVELEAAEIQRIETRTHAVRLARPIAACLTPTADAAVHASDTYRTSVTHALPDAESVPVRPPHSTLKLEAVTEITCPQILALYGTCA